MAKAKKFPKWAKDSSAKNDYLAGEMAHPRTAGKPAKKQAKKK